MNIRGIPYLSAFHSTKKSPSPALTATQTAAEIINQKLSKTKADVFEKTELYTALYLLEYETKQEKAEYATPKTDTVSFTANKPATPCMNPYIAAQSNLDDIARCLYACRDYVSLIRDYESMANDMALSQNQRDYAAEGILRLKEQIAATSATYVKCTVDGFQFQNDIRWDEESTAYVDFTPLGEKSGSTGSHLSPVLDRSNPYFPWDMIFALTNHISPKSLGITGLAQKSADEIEQALTNALAVLEEESGKLTSVSNGATSGLTINTVEWGNSHVACFEKIVMQRGNNDYWVDGKLTERSKYWDYSIYGAQMTDLMHETMLNKTELNIPEQSIHVDPSHIIHLDVIV